MDPDILDRMMPEQREDEDRIAKMYAVISDLEPDRRKRLTEELNRRLHREQDARPPAFRYLDEKSVEQAEREYEYAHRPFL
jgi:hypothetical protein